MTAAPSPTHTVVDTGSTTPDPAAFNAGYLWENIFGARMERRIIHSTEAPSSPLYSQAVKVGELVYLSGIVGVDPKTRQLAGPTIEQQTRQAIRNCESVLKSAGASLAEVVQVTVLLTEPTDFDGMNLEYAKSFPSDPPARMVTKLGVALPGVRVSIAMTAVARPDSG